MLKMSMMIRVEMIRMSKVIDYILGGILHREKNKHEGWFWIHDIAYMTMALVLMAFIALTLANMNEFKTLYETVSILFMDIVVVMLWTYILNKLLANYSKISVIIFAIETIRQTYNYSWGVYWFFGWSFIDLLITSFTRTNMKKRFNRPKDWSMFEADVKEINKDDQIGNMLRVWEAEKPRDRVTCLLCNRNYRGNNRLELIEAHIRDVHGNILKKSKKGWKHYVKFYL
jgi:hypothetical protein